MPKIRGSVVVAGFALLLAGSAVSLAAPLPTRDQSVGPTAPQTVP